MSSSSPRYIFVPDCPEVTPLVRNKLLIISDEYEDGLTAHLLTENFTVRRHFPKDPCNFIYVDEQISETKLWKLLFNE